MRTSRRTFRAASTLARGELWWPRPPEGRGTPAAGAYEVRLWRASPPLMWPRSGAPPNDPQVVFGAGFQRSARQASLDPLARSNSSRNRAVLDTVRIVQVILAADVVVVAVYVIKSRSTRTKTNCTRGMQRIV